MRHYAVKKPFLKGWVRQSQVMVWFEEYDRSTELELFETDDQHHWEKCYSSMLPRAVLTAKNIRGESFEARAALNEPHLSPIFSTDVCLPFLVWAMLFRTAILCNHKGQSARKEILVQRMSQELENILSSEKGSVLIVSHALIMGIMSSILIKKGFSGRKLGRTEHAKVYIFEK